MVSISIFDGWLGLRGIVAEYPGEYSGWSWDGTETVESVDGFVKGLMNLSGVVGLKLRCFYAALMDWAFVSLVVKKIGKV